ncbi:MAG: replication-associated recombination protein A [Bdellovibrionales bacterium]|nr:replication-associated recombination protein A [Bdellovibrionales bacterium]
MDLFDALKPDTEPLAHRLRPKTLQEWIGHDKVLGERGLVTSWLKSKRFPSILLWGPPGVGKTSLAILIAETLGEAFIQLSAVSSGVKDIKEAAEKALGYQRMGRRTILFFDEIHRLNKAQQDSLLPHVEKGLFTLIGATTENPSFEVNAALLSRMRVIRLDRLREQDLERVLDHALTAEAGFGGKIEFTPEARTHLIGQSEGDARRLLTLVESIALLAPELKTFDDETVKKFLEQLGDRVLPYDKQSEEHYNTISAFIKSMRASNPDAAVYYLARMLEAGEDPMFIARRMIVFASEDVGNADPRALPLAIAGKDALECVGLPEARINLAHVAISLALARKDKASYNAINAAMAEVQETGALPVPMILRNAVTKLMEAEGYGKGDPTKLLPEGLKETSFYRPKPIERPGQA